MITRIFQILVIVSLFTGCTLAYEVKESELGQTIPGIDVKGSFIISSSQEARIKKVVDFIFDYQQVAEIAKIMLVKTLQDDGKSSAPRVEKTVLIAVNDISRFSWECFINFTVTTGDG
jgi:hypothetical protein